MTLVQLIYLVHQLSILHFLGNLDTCWFVHSKPFYGESMAHRTNIHQQKVLLGIIQHPRISESQTFGVPPGQKNAEPPAWHKRESERSRRVSKKWTHLFKFKFFESWRSKVIVHSFPRVDSVATFFPCNREIIHNPVREKILIRCESWN